MWVFFLFLSLCHLCFIFLSSPEILLMFPVLPHRCSLRPKKCCTCQVTTPMGLHRIDCSLTWMWHLQCVGSVNSPYISISVGSQKPIRQEGFLKSMAKWCCCHRFPFPLLSSSPPLLLFGCYRSCLAVFWHISPCLLIMVTAVILKWDHIRDQLLKYFSWYIEDRNFVKIVKITLVFASVFYNNIYLTECSCFASSAPLLLCHPLQLDRYYPLRVQCYNNQ